MAITLSKRGSNSTTGATTRTIAFTGVTAGSVLICSITKHPTTAAVFSVADNVNGAWSAVVQLDASGRKAEIWQFASSASGDLTITVTSTVSVAFRIAAYALLGANPTAEDTGTRTNVTADPMFASPATGFNLTAGAFVAAAIAPANTVGVSVLDSDYTAESVSPTVDPFGAHAYRIVGGSPITDEEIDWNVTTSRSGPGVCASWAAAAGFKAAWLGSRNNRILGGGFR